MGFVVECFIGGISLWGGGSSSTNRGINGFILFVVLVPYLELVLLVTGIVGFG